MLHQERVEQVTYMMASMSQEVLMVWTVYPSSREQDNGRLAYLRQQLATDTQKDQL